MIGATVALLVCFYTTCSIVALQMTDLKCILHRLRCHDDPNANILWYVHACNVHSQPMRSTHSTSSLLDAAAPDILRSQRMIHCTLAPTPLHLFELSKWAPVEIQAFRRLFWPFGVSER